MSIQMIVIKNGEAFDMSPLVESVKWSGRLPAAPRKLIVTFLYYSQLET